MTKDIHDTAKILRSMADALERGHITEVFVVGFENEDVGEARAKDVKALVWTHGSNLGGAYAIAELAACIGCCDDTINCFPGAVRVAVRAARDARAPGYTSADFSAPTQEQIAAGKVS